MERLTSNERRQRQDVALRYVEESLAALDEMKMRGGVDRPWLPSLE
jgi:hypothetical protein